MFLNVISDSISQVTIRRHIHTFELFLSKETVLELPIRYDGWDHLCVHVDLFAVENTLNVNKFILSDIPSGERRMYKTIELEQLIVLLSGRRSTY